MIKSAFVTLLFILLASPCQAATYNYYFSNAATGNAQGSDSTGAGTETSPWATLSKADTELDALAPTDICYLYFDMGDTWSEDSSAVGAKNCYGLFITTDHPTTHVSAYGIGNDPIFDGQVADFSTVPDHDATNGPTKWNSFISIGQTNCSVSNINFQNLYGHAIFLNDNLGSSDNFILSGNTINDFGSCAITTHASSGTGGIEVSRNLIHTGQQLMRYNKTGGVGWSAAVTLAAKTQGVASFCDGAHVHHNIIYDIFGEGIISPNSIIEYNIVGDTASFGIGTDPRDFDVTEGIVRYNLVVFSDYDTSNYTGAPGIEGGTSPGAPTGIRYFDDYPGGDNSSGDVEIYGNIVINRDVGIWFYQSEDPGNPLNSIKIYNNIVIDSLKDNFRIYHAPEANSGYFYNNLSVLYDRPTGTHIEDDTTFPDAGWTATYNHYWTIGGSPSVDTDWDDNYITTDPELAGETATNWISQTGATYYKNIDLAKVFPAVNGTGLTLGSSFNHALLSAWDYSGDPSEWTSALTTQEAPFVTGAVIEGAASSPSTNPLSGSFFFFR